MAKLSLIWHLGIVPIESAEREFIAKEVVLENSIDLDTNQVAMIWHPGQAPMEANFRQISIAPSRLRSAIGYDLTRPNQIKTVLQDEQESCAIE
jgi:hypothetical protein